MTLSTLIIDPGDGLLEADADAAIRNEEGDRATAAVSSSSMSKPPTTPVTSVASAPPKPEEGRPQEGVDAVS
jgi:hypothetical protein